MRRMHLVALGMAWVMFAVPCLQMQARGEAISKGEPAKRVYFDASRESTSPDKVYAALWERQQHQKLSFEETMDMAMALLLQQNWDRAAGVYQSAAGTVTDSGKKAAAICGAGQSLAATGKWTEAGKLMNEANRLVPNSKAAAALRLAYWTNAGDMLEIQVAQDRMKQLNLNSEGSVVCGPGSIIAMVAITVWADRKSVV